MKPLLKILLLFIGFVLLMGCRGEGANGEAAAPAGPALVMFYTDN